MGAELDELNAKTDQAVQLALDAKATNEAVMGVLGEIKAALDAAINANDANAIAAAAQRLGLALDQFRASNAALAAAATAVDLTPETPVPG